MTIVRRPSPFGEIMTLRQAMDRLFDDDYRPSRWLSGGFDGPGLPLDVTTDADKLTIEAAPRAFARRTSTSRSRTAP